MIRAAGITKKFGSFTALDEVTCNILDGCVYGLVGSNGAGKSTFLRVLAGIYKPDEGVAYFDDEPVIRFNDVENIKKGIHNFKCVVTYEGETKIANVDKYYETTN